MFSEHRNVKILRVRVFLGRREWLKHWAVKDWWQNGENELPVRREWEHLLLLPPHLPILHTLPIHLLFLATGGKGAKLRFFCPFLSEHLSEHVIFKVDPEKKKKYLAYAKETVYWEACLEKGERLEQKVTCSVHLPFALSFISNFLVHRIHGKSSEHAWPSVSYSSDGSSLPWLSTKYRSSTTRWPILTRMRFWRWIKTNLLWHDKGSVQKPQ